MPQFNFLQTEDGSPSLRIIKGSEAEAGEAMHSLRGAFSETLYVYGTALKQSLEQVPPLRVLSLGLGLGYVEILSCGLSLQANRTDLTGESFELLPELNQWFRAWACGGINGADKGAEKGADDFVATDVPDAFRLAYDDILNRTARELSLEASAIRALLANLLQSGAWRLNESLTAETKLSQPFGCICFDAFSSKTSPDLWTENFLVKFFKDAAAENCIVSTYACTGALKRSLKASGFDVQVRQGFSSKRDSTFAVRLN